MTGNGGMENGSAWLRTRFGSLDVLADVPHELSAQIGDGGEDATGDDVPLDPGEPQFDLVEPGRVSRREVQVDRRMASQELGDLLGFVRRQVISDHMDFLGRRPIDDDVGQKGNKLCRVCRAVVLPSTSSRRAQ